MGPMQEALRSVEKNNGQLLAKNLDRFRKVLPNVTKPTPFFNDAGNNKNFEPGIHLDG